MQIDTNIPEVARRQIERIAEVCERIKPLVVIRCITYNHEAFLKDALEGFLMQKTDFPFVAVVHDDASTDGTAAILRKYAEQYPDIILPIYEEENQYSKRDRSIGRIMYAASKATGAKYIAWCEGDDYWIAPKKLQKQVTALENDPKYKCSYTAFIPLNSTGATIKDEFYKDNIAKSYTGNIFPQLLKGNYIQTCTFMCHIDVIDNPIYVKLQKGIDYALFLSAAIMGESYYITEPTSVYRITNTGAMRTSISNVIDTNEDIFLHFMDLNVSRFKDIKYKDKVDILNRLLVVEWKHKSIYKFQTVRKYLLKYTFIMLPLSLKFVVNMILRKVKL